MKKFAICISGQIRNDDSALVEISKALEGIDADIFISVWKNRGTKTFGGASGPDHMARIFGEQVASAIPRNWLGRMREVFPNSGPIFPNMGTVSKEDLKEFFPNATIEIEPETLDLSFSHSDSNSLRMLYKIWRCNGMKKAAEIAAGETYEKVVRLRPDICLDFHSIFGRELGSNDVLTHAHRGISKDYIQDIYWAGSSKVDDQMTLCFPRAIECQRKNWKGIHLELFELTERQKLTIVSGNALQTNLNKYAENDTCYKKQVRDNFIDAVSRRDMNVGFAGGEQYCSIAERVLKAAAAKEDRVKFLSDTQQLVSDVSSLILEKPPLRHVVVSMGCRHFIADPSIDFLTRLKFMIFLIRLELVKGSTVISDSLLKSVKTLQTDNESLLAQILVGDVDSVFKQAKEAVDIPKQWGRVLEEKSKVNGLDSNQKCMDLMLLNDETNNHIFKTLLGKSEFTLALELAEHRIDYGIKSFNTFFIAAKACNALGKNTQEFTYLLNADQLQNAWSVKMRLAEINLKNGDTENAKQFLDMAAKLEGSQQKVSELLAKL